MRRIPIFLALALMLSLAGCGGAAKEEDRGFDSTRSFTRYFSGVLAAETPDTLYFISRYDQFLKYVDKATDISGVLCGKTECHHDSTDCNGYVEGPIWDIIVDGGRLYWIGRSAKDYRDCCLYSAALDGTDRRAEAELPSELLTDIAGYYHCVLHDKQLYLGDFIYEIVDGEPTLYYYVAAFPLDSAGEPYVILREELPYNSFDSSMSIQFYGGYLYILTNTMTRSAGEAGESLFHFQIRRWAPGADEFETLYEEDGSPLKTTYDFWVTDDSIFFNRNLQTSDDLETRIYRYDFDTGECEYLFDNGVRGWVSMGMIADHIVTGYQMTDDHDGIYDFHIVLKDFEGNVLADETCQLDLHDVPADYNQYQTEFLGRDEQYAYYTFFATANSSGDDGGNQDMTYVTIIAAALDGSGAKVMCTQAEQHIYS